MAEVLTENLNTNQLTLVLRNNYTGVQENA
jgi:hypothetical protein